MGRVCLGWRGKARQKRKGSEGQKGRRRHKGIISSLWYPLMDHILNIQHKIMPVEFYPLFDFIQTSKSLVMVALNNDIVLSARGKTLIIYISFSVISIKRKFGWFHRWNYVCLVKLLFSRSFARKINKENNEETENYSENKWTWCAPIFPVMWVTK